MPNNPNKVEMLVESIQHHLDSIYYTLDGTSPTNQAIKYPDHPVDIYNNFSTVTLKAIAYFLEGTKSLIASAVYTFENVLPSPEFSLRSLSNINSRTVITLSCSVEGADIYYRDVAYTTHDLADPDPTEYNPASPTTSPTKLYNPTNGIVIQGISYTIKAVAVKSGHRNSRVVEAKYAYTRKKLPNIIPNPTPKDSGHTFPLTVTLAIPGINNVDLRYTTDGSPVTQDSTQYTGPITLLNENQPITARGFKFHYLPSERFYAVYPNRQVNKPTISPSGALPEGSSSVSVTLACNTPGAIIRYWLNGDVNNKTVYTGAITLSSFPVEISCQATQLGFRDSQIASESFAYQRVGSLSFTPSQVKCTMPQDVTIGIAASIASWDGTQWELLKEGIAGTVLAIATSGNDVYVGGNFTLIGNTVVNKVAKWNGTSWSALGSGIVGGDVYALETDTDGNLYVGGDFTGAGGVGVNRIAKWNGATWSALGSGVNNTVYALRYTNTENLYVGGAFTTAGGISSSRIARWSTHFSSWHAIADGPNLEVYAIAKNFSGGSMYVGGAFSSVGGFSCNSIARLDGSTWEAMDTGVNGSVKSIALTADETVYIGGSFTVASSLSANRVAKWDGDSWVALGSGANNEVRAIKLGVATLFVGGDFTTLGGNAAPGVGKVNLANNAWSTVGGGVDGSVYSLGLTSNGNLYVGGTFITSETSGITIKYTIDGSDPLTSGTAITYSSTFEITEDTTIKAVGTKTGYVHSPIAVKTIKQIKLPTPIPLAVTNYSPAKIVFKFTKDGSGSVPIYQPGTSNFVSYPFTNIATLMSAQKIDVDDIVIRYTTDGSNPTSSTGTVVEMDDLETYYGSPYIELSEANVAIPQASISFSDSLVIKAACFSTGCLDSNVKVLSITQTKSSSPDVIGDLTAITTGAEITLGMPIPLSNYIFGSPSHPWSNHYPQLWYCNEEVYGEGNSPINPPASNIRYITSDDPIAPETEPTISDTLYSAPFTLSQKNIKMKAFPTGFKPSDSVYRQFLNPTVPSINISTDLGQDYTYETGSIILSCTLGSTDIYYQDDGTEVVYPSNYLTYSEPIAVSGYDSPIPISAVGYHSGYDPSTPTFKNIYLKVKEPHSDINGDVLLSSLGTPQTVHLTSTTSGVQIRFYYEVGEDIDFDDVATPSFTPGSEAGFIYVDGVPTILTSSMPVGTKILIKARAWKNNWVQSDVVFISIRITDTLASPISRSGLFTNGNITTALLDSTGVGYLNPSARTRVAYGTKISLVSATNGASIHYTLNGDTPTEMSTEITPVVGDRDETSYQDPPFDVAPYDTYPMDTVATVTGEFTLKAIAAKTGYITSAVLAREIGRLKVPNPTIVCQDTVVDADNTFSVTVGDSSSEVHTYYTLDGSTPDKDTDPEYTVPVLNELTVGSPPDTVTIKVKSFRYDTGSSSWDRYEPSDTVSKVVTVAASGLDKPLVSCLGGDYDDTSRWVDVDPSLTGITIGALTSTIAVEHLDVTSPDLKHLYGLHFWDYATGPGIIDVDGNEPLSDWALLNHLGVEPLLGDGVYRGTGGPDTLRLWFKNTRTGYADSLSTVITVRYNAGPLNTPVYYSALPLPLHTITYPTNPTLILLVCDSDDVTVYFEDGNPGVSDVVLRYNIGLSSLNTPIIDPSETSTLYNATDGINVTVPPPGYVMGIKIRAFKQGKPHSGVLTVEIDRPQVELPYISYNGNIYESEPHVLGNRVLNSSEKPFPPGGPAEKTGGFPALNFGEVFYIDCDTPNSVIYCEYAVNSIITQLVSDPPGSQLSVTVPADNTDILFWAVKPDYADSWFVNATVQLKALVCPSPVIKVYDPYDNEKDLTDDLYFGDKVVISVPSGSPSGMMFIGYYFPSVSITAPVDSGNIVITISSATTYVVSSPTPHREFQVVVNCRKTGYADGAGAIFHNLNVLTPPVTYPVLTQLINSSTEPSAEVYDYEVELNTTARFRFLEPTYSALSTVGIYPALASDPLLQIPLGNNPLDISLGGPGETTIRLGVVEESTLNRYESPNRYVFTFKKAEEPFITIDPGEPDSTTFQLNAVNPGSETIKYCTTPACTPTTTATSGADIAVTSTTTVRFLSRRTNYLDSDIVEVEVEVTPDGSLGPKCATPTVSSPEILEDLLIGDEIEIACATEDVEIFYSIDGNDPTILDEPPTLPLVVNTTSFTLKAIAIKDGYRNSDIMEVEVTVLTTPDPVVEPESGVYTYPQEVTITCSDEEAVIKYTTNLTNPITSGTVYTDPFDVDATYGPVTVKAVAMHDTWANSNIISNFYTTVESPIPSSSPGGVPYGEEITLSCATGGATIYYTLDGSPATDASTVYDADVFTVTSITHIRAIAKLGSVYSVEFDGTFQIQVAAPTVEPPSGDYGSYPPEVSASCSTSGADIYYIRYSEEPELYTGPFLPTTAGDVLYISFYATKEGWLDSVPVDRVYGILLPPTDPPTADPDSGTLTPGSVVTLSAEEGADIFYTLDGGNPAGGPGAIGYTRPIPMNQFGGTVTLKATAILPGHEYSELLEIEYTMADPDLVEILQPFWKCNEPYGVRYDNTDKLVDLTEGNYMTTVAGKVNADAVEMYYNYTNLTKTDNDYIGTKEAESVVFGGWVKIDTFTPSQGVALLRVQVDSTAEHLLEYVTGETDRFVYIMHWKTIGTSDTGSTTVTANTFGELTDSDWHFVLCWYDYEAGMIYIQVDNGTPDSAEVGLQNSGFYTSQTTELRFGGYAGEHDFDGAMDSWFYAKGVIESSHRDYLWNDGDGVTWPLDSTEAQCARPTSDAADFTDFESEDHIVLSCATSGATIHYTVDGSRPTESSPTFSSFIEITESMTLKAIAVKVGYLPSDIMTWTYYVPIPAATPGADPGPGAYPTDTEVTLSCALEGATIRYTTNGTTPTESSDIYSSPIVLTTFPKTVKAKAYMTHWLPSDLMTATYTQAQVDEPTLETGTPVQPIDSTFNFNSLGEGFTIYYTLDGSPATTGSTAWDGNPFGLIDTGTPSLTIRAIGHATGYLNSTEMNVTITCVIPDPVVDPAGGGLDTCATDSITITEGTNTPGGTTIWYNQDGADIEDDGTEGTTYSGSFGYDGLWTTLKTRAGQSGFITSGQPQYDFEIAGAAAVTFSEPGGEVPVDTEISLSCTTPDAIIHYTTDESPVDGSSPLYEDPIVITGDVVIAAAAYSPCHVFGGETSESYTVPV